MFRHLPSLCLFLEYVLHDEEQEEYPDETLMVATLDGIVIALHLL